ncbi:hypothetical protein S100390_v1c07310 [Spiroplasma sp. NBRC 100390]|uniref:hypothetical protein n=1 Tax=unclassified Spiroplasma TaxID=2637901 RepID=UPI0008929BD4|nr:MULTISPECIES: hypothetical protein [unclassified Spiroplasma]AOX44067.1 hypothetical protein STU14_v1c07310 [Spiroplasma sp. TU-14]APE13537.1 hypothetical protein S100390_v1c07310 [Spiroplasma sp. NBRC 100390]
MKKVKDYKDWIDTYENPTESEKELIDEFKNILDEFFQAHEQGITLKNQYINELRNIIYKKNEELDEKDTIILKLKEECVSVNELSKINMTNLEKSHQQIYDNLKVIYQKALDELDEKDKQYGILLADRDKLEMYRHNRLKKSDVEVKVWCSHCERWVTDDIQDCYCQCTCNFGEDSDYDCIYEEDINAENDCPRNKEWLWQYEISNKQYESLED